MKDQLDFVAVGDMATDAFIRLKQAEIVDSVDHASKELCMTFGDKIPYEFAKVVRGVGNSPNAAVSAARLGLKTALISDVGDDQYGKECIGWHKENGESVDYIRMHKGLETNYHYVLWFGVERTILIKHEEYPYTFPKLSPPRWIYLSSLGEHSLPYHEQIAEYLKNNPEVKLAFQPGTHQMKFGVEALKDIYARTELFFCNVQEAKRILKTEESDIKKLLNMIHELGPKIVFITDGIDGAYVKNGDEYWFMPVYPQEPYERTGAGDAFASTVTAAIALGKSIEEALKWGPINSASVVQYVGAQEGLLKREELETRLAKAPADYIPKKI